MFTFEETFTRFARLMDEEEIWQDPAITFRQICRKLRVPRRRFSRFLWGELGYRGEEILRVYRASSHKKA